MAINTMTPGEGLDLDNPNQQVKQDGPVECLGKTFANDAERREHYLAILAEKLKDPEFRKIEGFPIGEDEAILELSDPPYYTACPNPFIEDFIACYGRQYDPAEGYKREPYAADVSEGKNNQIYRAHPYHTKVPHKAIMRYILHYTSPGDLVFDAFSGTGMTSVAAQLCGDKEEVESLGYRVLGNETVMDKLGNDFSRLGSRRSVVSDLSPIATFISSNYGLPVSVDEFERKCDELWGEVYNKCLWMFSTVPESRKDSIDECVDNIKDIPDLDVEYIERNFGQINFTVWSDVYSCPECASPYNYYNSAISSETGKVLKEYLCPECGSRISKTKSGKVTESYFDGYLGEEHKRVKRELVEISYTYAGSRYTKRPDLFDFKLFEFIESFARENVPTNRMMDGQETRRNDPSGITNVHHFYTPRNLRVLGVASNFSGDRNLMLAITGINLSVSKMYRWTPNYEGGGPMSGTLYVPALLRDISALDALKRFLSKLPKVHSALTARKINQCMINTSSSSNLSHFPSESMDYIFLDPPFGANINYSELSYLWESWLGIWTAIEKEAIENKRHGKDVNDYRELMTSCFKEAYRLLKPGRWMTVEFSNTKASIWNSIQTALGDAGFIVANVSALDKKQGSFKAITTTTAVKQDLVISAYKPNGGFEGRFVKESDEDGIWDFVRTHLGYLPVVKKQNDELTAIPERDPRLLFDQVVSYFVRNLRDVPVSSKYFQEGLAERFAERDGMIFLPDQVAEYDKARISSKQLKQLSIFVDDEASAIEWIRQLLNEKPQTYQDIHPKFINELSGWKQAEEQLELSKLLDQNFLKYKGKGPVPPQIHSYLSSNFKEMRKLSKDDSQLVNKAKDRWFVANPDLDEQLQELRERDLLKQFEGYKIHTGRKLKTVRMEAVRCGFKKAWQERDYKTIINVAEKIPQDLLQEDQKLLMWYDQAQTRASDESLF